MLYLNSKNAKIITKVAVSAIIIAISCPMIHKVTMSGKQTISAIQVDKKPYPGIALPITSHSNLLVAWEG